MHLQTLPYPPRKEKSKPARHEQAPVSGCSGLGVSRPGQSPVEQPVAEGVLFLVHEGRCRLSGGEDLAMVREVLWPLAVPLVRHTLRTFDQQSKVQAAPWIEPSKLDFPQPGHDSLCPSVAGTDTEPGAVRLVHAPEARLAFPLNGQPAAFPGLPAVSVLRLAPYVPCDHFHGGSLLSLRFILGLFAEG